VISPTFFQTSALSYVVMMMMMMMTMMIEMKRWVSRLDMQVLTAGNTLDTRVLYHRVVLVFLVSFSYTQTVDKHVKTF